MFEKASRLKLRFPSPQGNLTTEDLWTLPLTSRKKGLANLDDLAKALYQKVNDAGQQSFVVKDSQPDEELKLQFEIVKHVIDYRLEELQKAKHRESVQQKKQQILQLIAEKENEELKQSSIDDLKALLENL